MAKTNYRKITMEIIEDCGSGIKEDTKEFEAAVKYVEQWWEGTLSDKMSAKSMDMTPKEYAMASIGNGIMDGMHEEFMEEEEDQQEQEIIPVSQTELKKALRALATKENDYLAFLYEKWEEYNDQLFYGQLSHPLITIEKLNNKTLGNYTHGQDAMGITNHIRFNRNFIAMNDEVRVLETLRHEMIHQWQDEVLYMQEGVAKRDITIPEGFGKFTLESEPAVIKRNKSGTPVSTQMEQKHRPKEWHNKDFKEYAVVVGIPAIGDKCHGNPAVMPEGKSYNRKYTCGCIASNGSPLTIWSTREVNAVCTVCSEKFAEQKKEGKLVAVKLSDIEKPGEDAVYTKMQTQYQHFEKFHNKRERDSFLDVLYKDGAEGLEVEQGFYMKGHNAYKEGFTHWVAYNGTEVKPVANKKVEVKAPASEGKKVDKKQKAADNKEKPKAKQEPKKPSAKKAPAKKKPEPKVEEPKVELPKEEKPKKPAKPKKEPKPVKKPDLKVVETPAEDVTIIEEPKKEEKTVEGKSHTNPQDLLALYKEFGSVKKVAEHFGMTPAAIIYQAKKTGVNFKQGVIEDVPVKS